VGQGGGPVGARKGLFSNAVCNVLIPWRL